MTFDHNNVIVVGAGLAGLACAYALSKKDFNVKILEAEAYAGGRVVRESVGDFSIDLGANLFLETHETARDISDQLGVPLRRTPLAVHSAIYRNGKFHSLYGDNQLGSLWKTARTMLSFQLLSPRGVWQLLKFVRMLQAQKQHLSFDDVSRLINLDVNQNAADFLASKIGSESLEWLFEPGLSGYAFADPNQVGAAYAMAVLWHNGLNGVAWPCLPKGGASAIVDSLVNACNRSASLTLSTPARLIHFNHSTVQGVVTDAGLIEADAVVCATTASAAIKITPDLPPSVHNTLSQVTYSKCCRVFYGVDSCPFPQDWYAVGFPQKTGTFLTGLSNSAALDPTTAPEGKFLIDALVSGEHAQELFTLSDEQIQNQVLAEIIRLIPQMTQEPLFARVHRWPQAMCLAPAGTMTQLNEMRLEGYGGANGLFLAGDYMGVPSMNAALKSGLDAAAATIEYLQ